MGWYSPNYSMSEPFNYGRGEGCTWISKPCSPATWNRYWCQTAAVEGCNGHRTAGGYCTYSSYQSALPTPFQYFSDPTQGGASPWNDYCPVYEGYSNRYCLDTDNSPRSEAYGEYYGFYYGLYSYCWDLTGAAVTDGCYTTQCYQDPTTTNPVVLRVNINSQWVDCPAEGGNVQVEISIIETITVICPEVGFFCSVIGSSAVNFTFDPGNNIPIPNATPVSRLPSWFPDIPLPPGLPELGDEFKKFLEDPWSLTVGSDLFYVLIAVGVILIFIIVCCICKK